MTEDVPGVGGRLLVNGRLCPGPQASREVARRRGRSGQSEQEVLASLADLMGCPLVTMTPSPVTLSQIFSYPEHVSATLIAICGHVTQFYLLQENPRCCV
jgi:hypothetical protein